MSGLVVAAALLLQPASPSTEAPAAAPATAPAAAPRATGGSEVVCHPSPGSGRIQGPPVCHTRDEWEAMARQAATGQRIDRACRPGHMSDC